MGFQKFPMPGKGLNGATHRRVGQEIHFWWDSPDIDIFNAVWREIPENIKRECARIGRDLKRDIFHSIRSWRIHLNQTTTNIPSTIQPRKVSVDRALQSQVIRGGRAGPSLLYGDGLRTSTFEILDGLFGDLMGLYRKRGRESSDGILARIWGS
jgi:hypothetical protein